MKSVKREFKIEEIEGRFVVIDRQAWDQEKPEALLSIVGSARLAAGPFGSRAAETALRKLGQI